MSAPKADALPLGDSPRPDANRGILTFRHPQQKRPALKFLNAGRLHWLGSVAATGANQRVRPPVEPEVELPPVPCEPRPDPPALPRGVVLLVGEAVIASVIESA